MGRYDFTSAGSMFDFFRRGVMDADLNNDGTAPADNDLLNSSTKNGANASTFSFSSRAVSGSLEHCLSGYARTAAMTSLVVTSRNCENSRPGGAGVNDGGGASMVAVCTAATFSSK